MRQVQENTGVLKGLSQPEITEEKLRWASWTLLVNRGKKHSYEGTVEPHVIAARRKKNKAAKLARKVHRNVR